MLNLRAVAIGVLFLGLCGCTKITTEFQLYFYPPGTGLKNNDWDLVANVNGSTKAAGLLRSEPMYRITVSIRKRGEDPEVAYAGEWSPEAITSTQGQWISQDQFQLEVLASVNEIISSKTTLEIDVIAD